jgi:hypothetical protein
MEKHTVKLIISSQIGNSIKIYLIFDFSEKKAKCDTTHHLVAEKVTDILSVTKYATQMSDMERFNIMKLNNVEDRIVSP